MHKDTDERLSPPEASFPVNVSPFHAAEGDFTISGHLGVAWIRVPGYAPCEFDVISQKHKLEFETEYSAMVRDIAGKCNQLLLELGSPTTLAFGTDRDAATRPLPLEQFLFLRSQLDAETLPACLEMVRRRPHAVLTTESEWVPLGAGPVTPRFYGDPLRYGTDWQTESGRQAALRSLPGHVMTERKYESLDTPANRFVKFALQQFRELCEQVVKHSGTQSGPAFREAECIRGQLDAFLAEPLFAEVSPLRLLPLGNQTLQKREGYRQILQAWLMLQEAVKLDWPGVVDALRGWNRDVPALYEYWLFFVIRQALQDAGLRQTDAAAGVCSGPIQPFVCRANHGLRISLQRDTASMSAFLWEPEGIELPLRVHLYYNRTFTGTHGGSYSRQFRPDYTLAMFPACCETEEKAKEQKRLAYLHFDAKYRVEALGDVVGEKTEQDADIDKEKRAIQANNTYCRGDLYKMHTYNDAIALTQGSYVLYPGRDKDYECYRDGFVFREWDGRRLFYRDKPGSGQEALPGVGAFILRPEPSNVSGEVQAVGDRVLASFLSYALRVLADGALRKGAL